MFSTWFGMVILPLSMMDDGRGVRCKSLSARIQTSGTYCKIYRQVAGHLIHTVTENRLSKKFSADNRDRTGDLWIALNCLKYGVSIQKGGML